MACSGLRMSQKMENQLNLALELPEEVRLSTGDLNVGYDSVEKTWELIAKYNGSAEDLVHIVSLEYEDRVIVEPLIAGYAILTVPESLVERVSADSWIEYIEKPKNFYFTQEGPFAHACIAGVVAGEPFLNGEGVLIAVIDSGIDYQRREFQNADGSTRIRFFWDQTALPMQSDPERKEVGSQTDFFQSDGAWQKSVREIPEPPDGFREGAEYDETWINETLRLTSGAQRFERMPTIDVSGHGTAVAGIAAASPTENYRGVAAKAQLMVVKLGGTYAGDAGFSKTTQIMRGVTYCVKKAQQLNMPVVINLSFGNTYGAHDGSSLLERFLDQAALIGRSVICVGSGNEANTAGHVSGNVLSRGTVELVIADFERNLGVQIWKHYSDRFGIALQTPGGNRVQLMPEREGTSPGGYILRVDGMRIFVYFGEPTPYSVLQEVYLEMLPEPGQDYLSTGIWQFLFEPIKIVEGMYQFYLPSAILRSTGTGFVSPTPDETLTIPSSAARVITVGAFDEVFDAYADFSGRGFLRGSSGMAFGGSGAIKPDVAAPGVNIKAPNVAGGYSFVSGTSFATPIVSGSAALLMEWGIARGNDPYLYGEKMKAYLRAGAQPIRGEMNYPNEKVGYGAVCVAESIPKMNAFS